MTNFKDIFKRSFIEGFSRYDMTPENIIICFAIATILSVYIFAIYRLMTRKTFYSKTFNIALFAITEITTAVILAVQSNVVVSLGMVGALSIVRFRTAIKDPLDLIFLFWAITTGIVTGAGQAEIAFVLAFILTISMFILDRLPIAKAPKILMVGGTGNDFQKKITETVKKYCAFYTIKSCAINNGHYDIVVELRTSKESDLVEEISKIEGVTSSSFLCHNGEVTY